jgi:hypothetical protein
MERVGDITDQDGNIAYTNSLEYKPKLNSMDSKLKRKGSLKTENDGNQNT